MFCSFFWQTIPWSHVIAHKFRTVLWGWRQNTLQSFFYGNAPLLSEKCPCPACRVHITYNVNRDLLLPLQENGRECYEVTFKTWLPFRQRHSGRFVSSYLPAVRSHCSHVQSGKWNSQSSYFNEPELNERCRVWTLISFDLTWQALK